MERSVEVREDLRGYRMEMLPADLRAHTISVSLLASSFCPTDRNVYVERVLRLAGRGTETWPRVVGREIHRLLQQLHRFAREYVGSFAARRTLSDFDIYGAMMTRADDYIACVREELSADGNNPRSEIARLSMHLSQVAAFAAMTAATFLNYRISRTGIGARSLQQEMDSWLDFRAVEQELQAGWLGLTEPVTPDFLYRRRVIGDIKTGEVDAGPGGPFELTCTAYALAWERVHGEPIDWGVVLHVSHNRRRNVPIYRQSQIYPLDTTARIRLWDRLRQRLSLIRDGQDPSCPADREVCRGCVYEAVCYPEGEEDESLA